MFARRLMTMLCAFALVAALVPGQAGAEQLTGTLKKIKDTGTLVIGYRPASIPFSFLDKNEHPAGYSIDLCLRIAAAVKAKLHMKHLKIKYVQDSPVNRIPLIVNGTTDLECGSSTNTLIRQQQVDFALTTFITGTQLLVKKGSGIKQIEDMNGKVIALAPGTTNFRVIKNIIKKEHLNIKVINVKDHPEGFLAVETGRADAYSTDGILLHGLIVKSKHPKDYAVVGRLLSYEPYSFMIRRNDDAFRLVVDTTLANLFRTGEIYKIYDKWFDPMGFPASKLLKAAFQIQAIPEQ